MNENTVSVQGHKIPTSVIYSALITTVLIFSIVGIGSYLQVCFIENESIKIGACSSGKLSNYDTKMIVAAFKLGDKLRSVQTALPNGPLMFERVKSAETIALNNSKIFTTSKADFEYLKVKLTETRRHIEFEKLIDTIQTRLIKGIVEPK